MFLRVLDVYLDINVCHIINTHDEIAKLNVPHCRLEKKCKLNAFSASVVLLRSDFGGSMPVACFFYMGLRDRNSCVSLIGNVNIVKHTHVVVHCVEKTSTYSVEYLYPKQNSCLSFSFSDLNSLLCFYIRDGVLLSATTDTKAGRSHV